MCRKLVSDKAYGGKNKAGKEWQICITQSGDQEGLWNGIQRVKATGSAMSFAHCSNWWQNSPVLTLMPPLEEIG